MPKSGAPLANVQVAISRRASEFWTIAWSPDSQWIAAAGADGVVWLWRVGEPQPALLEGHQGAIHALAWSPDGTTIASASEDSTVRLWGAAKGRRFVRTLAGHSALVRCVVWSSREALASGSDDGTVRLWDISKEHAPRVLRVREGITSLAWSPEIKTLASGSSDSTVRLWDLLSDHVETLEGHSESVNCVLWSPDGKLIASGANDGMVLLWDTGKDFALRQLKGHRGPVGSVAWSPDGEKVASGSRDGTARIWGAYNGYAQYALEGHVALVNSVVWSPDGKVLASGSYDRTVRLWDAATGRALRTLEGHDSSVVSVAWSADGKTLASSSSDSTVRLWDPSSSTALHTLAGHKNRADCVVWSPDGKAIASGLHNGTVRLWDAATGHARPRLDGHLDSVNSLAWSPDGERVASGSDDGAVRLWDATGKALQRLEGNRRSVNSLAWSPDGERVASGYNDGDVRVWDADRGHLVCAADRSGSYVTSVAWSPDGKAIASASSTTIRLWDAASGLLLRAMNGHRARVRSLAWSPDGKSLASASDEKTLRLWDIATGQTILVLEGHASSVRHLTWSKDGKLLASLGVEGDAIVWDARAGRRIVATAPLTYRHAGVGLAFVEEPAQWDSGSFFLLNLAGFASPERAEEQVLVTSAKVVLAGDSNAGKTCLARRLVEDRFLDGQATTHGMQIWTMSAESLDPDAMAHGGQRREVFLWDLGGQDEYQLVNQLFLNETTVALILFDPSRGKVSLESAEAWNERLTARARSPMRKLLVPAKADQAGIVRESDIEALQQRLSFEAAVAVSASRDGDQGIATLRRELNRAIGWDQLAVVSRPPAFQEIREVIQELRQGGTSVVYLADLENVLRGEHVLYEARELEIVLEQLAREGQIVEIRHQSGDRVLVLRIDAISRYAGSLVQTARKHPRGAPVLEQDRILSAEMTFPGMPKEERLPRREEKVVLECVARLMVERGLCFDHQGLLVFPTLLDDLAAHQDPLPPSAPIYYDFSGPIDNIFASLVARLTVGQKFGAVRLWNRYAEFGPNASESFGIRRADRSKGKGHLDLFFGEKTAGQERRLFRDFVNEHLTKEGVKVSSGLAFPCRKCGYQFSKETIAKRLRDNKNDVRCPDCDEEYSLFAGMQSAGESRELAALITETELGIRQSERRVADAVTRPRQQNEEPLRILHLSDLHFTGETNELAVRQPLEADLREELKITKLDYVVVSGDFADKCTEKGWQAATAFIKALSNSFGLDPLQIILAPGNHDYAQSMDYFDVTLGMLGRDKDGNPLMGGVPKPNGRYPSRFARFREFYHGIYSAKTYPEDPAAQFEVIDDPDFDLRFLTLNSAWEIDQFHPERASLNNDALSAALSKGGNGKPGIVIWHHAATGDRKIADTEAVQKLGAAGYRVLLHGDVHEERDGLIQYLGKKRRIHVIGGGAFGAAAKDRPESTPRLYSLLEVGRDLSSIRVVRRRQKTPEGPYDAYAIYPGRTANTKKAHYTIRL